MKRFWGILLITTVVMAGGLLAETKANRAAVERAVLDYVEGVYEVKPDLIRRSVHPDLAKFGFARRSAKDDWRVIPMTFDQLVDLAGEWNADGSSIEKDAPKEVVVLDMLDQTAAAKLTAAWGVDYFHLAKYDGKWKIVHVLWQTLPE